MIIEFYLDEELDRDSVLDFLEEKISIILESDSKILPFKTENPKYVPEVCYRCLEGFEPTDEYKVICLTSPKAKSYYALHKNCRVKQDEACMF